MLLLRHPLITSVITPRCHSMRPCPPLSRPQTRCTPFSIPAQGGAALPFAGHRAARNVHPSGAPGGRGHQRCRDRGLLHPGRKARRRAAGAACAGRRTHPQPRRPAPPDLRIPAGCRAHQVRYAEFFWNPMGTAQRSRNWLPRRRWAASCPRHCRCRDRCGITGRLITAIDREAPPAAATEVGRDGCWPTGATR